MSEVITTPAPGFYPNVPADEYHAWDAASKSRLCEMAPPKRPAHLRHLLDNGREPRDCLRVGDAMHAVILEPDRFLEQYRVCGACSALKKDGTACSNVGANLVDGHWYCNTKGHTPPGEVDTTLAPLDPAEFEMMKGMRKAARAHPIARELLDAKGWTEPSCVWNDTDTGELMKCRLDMFVDWNGPTIVDFKSCLDASEDSFGKSVRKYFYHVQSAAYREGVMHAKGVVGARFVFVAIEKKPPYLVCCYEVPPEILMAGNILYHKLLADYRECRMTKRWPGYSERLEKLVMPAWGGEVEEVELSIGGVAVTM